MNIKTVEVDIIISRLLPYKIKTHYLVGYFRNGASYWKLLEPKRHYRVLFISILVQIYCTTNLARSK